MLNDDYLIDGENELGQYTVVIVRQSETGRWMPSVMQLGAVVTNYRLLLRPHRKKYEPASLPARYIRDVKATKRGNYHCISLRLITDDMLYLMLSTGHFENLLGDLQMMKVPIPRIKFDARIERHDVERLIAFFGQFPVADSTIP